METFNEFQESKAVQTFNQINYKVDASLFGFDMVKPESTNVDFYGIKGRDLFVQFKNGGSCWMYYVTPEIIDNLHNPPPGPDGMPLSPGKIIANRVVRKMISQSLSKNLISIIPNKIALLKKDIRSQWGFACAGTPVRLLAENGELTIVELDGIRFNMFTSDLLLKAN